MNRRDIRSEKTWRTKIRSELRWRREMSEMK